ncbi:MAG TPA: hypothetical protein VGH15_15105, partial [Caulobacteraceae bacterium]
MSRLWRAWWVMAVGFAAAALLTFLPAPFGIAPIDIAAVLFLWQDLPAVVLITVLAGVALWGAVRLETSGPRPAAPEVGAVARLIEKRRPGWLLALAIAGLCALIAWAGCRLVFSDYPLSADELMANFDAAIFAHGDLLAPVAPAWRDYTHALAPTFLFDTPGHDRWASAYLPVNAALRALGQVLGAQSLVNPLLAAISIVAVFGVARRLWPQRPHLALVAALLLATSSQFLITAMTPYAWTAHLAFNLVWLWLFLAGREGKRWGDAG